MGVPSYNHTATDAPYSLSQSRAYTPARYSQQSLFKKRYYFFGFMNIMASGGELNIRTESSCDEVTVRWDIPYDICSRKHKVIVILKNVDTGWQVRRNPGRSPTALFYDLEPNELYEVLVVVRYGQNAISGEKDVHTRLSVDDLASLRDDAEDLCKNHMECKMLYRDSFPDYYDDIKKMGNKMKKNVKGEMNGSDGSIIRGNLDGLFFGANVHRRTGRPVQPSIYGPRRLNVPVDYWFGRKKQPKLYFADYFPTGKSQCVQLVMTFSSTEADKFCRENLLSLDLEDNNFLWMDEGGDLNVTTDLWVEVFYTKNVDITDVLNKGGNFEDVRYKRHV